MASNETTLFDDLLTGLLEIEQHAKGQIERPTIERIMPKDEIKSIRTALNLSQTGLAEKLKISVKTLQNWEQGRTIPNIHSLMLLRMASREPKLFEIVARA